MYLQITKINTILKNKEEFWEEWQNLKYYTKTKYKIQDYIDKLLLKCNTKTDQLKKLYDKMDATI